jgi:hypothetical protein
MQRGDVPADSKSGEPVASRRAAEMSSSGKDTSRKQLDDFSLVVGGPLYQLWRRAHLAGDELRFARRRMVVLALLAWVPLLLLSLSEGRAWGGGVALTFLRDVETHVRLLIAVPLLIVAEVKVHKRLAPVVRSFLDRGLIPDAARPRFDAALSSAMRLRNSVVAELLMVALVYGVTVPFVWRTQATLDVSSWYMVVGAGAERLSRAGWWAACVSLPLFQFLVVRWYFRLFIWARFLWQVSRIRLNLTATHPDGTAGLQFLDSANRAYSYVLLAQGTVLAGLIANRVFYDGAKLADFKVEVFGMVGLVILAILGPLCVFTPQILQARRSGMREFGALGQRYANEFERKWLARGEARDEPLIGSADIQSLADLRNSFMTIRAIDVVPFNLKTVRSLALTTLLPVAPLLLTTFSVEELLDRVLKVLF